MHITVEYTNDGAILRGPLYLNEEIRDMTKALGGRFNRGRKTWELSPYDAPQLVEILRNHPEVTSVRVNGKAPHATKLTVVRLDELKHMPADLFAHQKAGLLRLLKQPRWGFFWEPGTGKTRLIIEGFSALLAMGKVSKLLVVCPLSIIDDTWVRQIAQYAPSLMPINLHREKSKAFRAGALWNVVITNYESFKKHADDLRCSGVDMLTIDESSKCKSYKTQITKALIKFSDHTTRVYCLSGTPAPNSDTEWWGQMRMLDGTLLGKSFYSYRARWFMNVGFQFQKWVLKPSVARTDLLRRIGLRATFVRKEDCLDLPPKIRETRSQRLNTEEEKAYKELKQRLSTEIDDVEIAAPTVIARIMKLRQITAGFAYDDTGKTHFTGDTKLKMLAEVLDEIGSAQAILWIQFRAEAARLEEWLRKNGYAQNVKLVGGMKDDERADAIKRFRSGDARYLIAHPASAGHGLDLPFVHYAVYLTASYSLEQLKQSEDRCHRAGSTQNVTYFYLLARRANGGQTIDHVIYKALEKKANLAEEAMRMLRE